MKEKKRKFANDNQGEKRIFYGFVMNEKKQRERNSKNEYK